VLADKDRAFKTGIEILNALQKQGPRAQWTVGKKSVRACAPLQPPSMAHVGTARRRRKCTVRSWVRWRRSKSS
jgi:hypothetical protein